MYLVFALWLSHRASATLLPWSNKRKTSTALSVARRTPTPSQLITYASCNLNAYFPTTWLSDCSQHARKHTGKTQPALVMVMPQPHEAVGIQPTTSLTVPHGDTGAANHSSSQHAPPNPSVDARSNTRDVNLRIPQVGAPIRMSRSARGATKVLNVQPNYFHEVNVAVLINRFSGAGRRHLVHCVPT